MKIKHLITMFAAAGLMVGNAFAVDVNTNTPQKKEIEDVVRDYLMKNPNVIIESLQSYQQKQMDQARQTIQKTQESSPKFVDALFHQASDPMAGNPKGKITVVEFFDYQCPHCVDMAPVIEELVKNNSEVRVIFKEFPIRGPLSEFASKAALAAHEQGKYYEFHQALMRISNQPLTQEAILNTAKSVGLDVEKLKIVMNGPSVSQKIQATSKLAQDLQLLGTPALFIAKSDVSKTSPATAVVFIPGQVNQEQLKEILNKINS